MSTERLYEVLTGSMSPSIREGDVLLVDPPPARWRVGDVVLLPPQGGRAEKVVHRLAGTSFRGGRLWLLTRGDANDFDDEPVLASEALGRVALIGREDGGAAPASGFRLAAARALGSVIVALTLSGALARLSRRAAALYARLRWRPARRALVALSLELEGLRRAALRDTLVTILARARSAERPR